MPVAVTARIHPTAVIDPEATLDEGVTVGPHVVIEGPVHVGANTMIRPGAYLVGPMTIGRNNDIGKGVVLGERPQHLGFKGEVTRTEIGDGNVFREYVTVNRASSPDKVTRIGNNNYLMTMSHVGHDAILGNRNILANSAAVAGHCVLQDGIFMSGLSAIHQFVRIGRLAFISGQSSSTLDVLPFMLVVGRNGVVGINVVGMRRAGIATKDISAAKEAYKIIYRSGQLLKRALAQVERELGHLEIIQEIIRFARETKRGILGSHQTTDKATKASNDAA